MKQQLNDLSKRLRTAYIAPIERQAGQAWSWWVSELATMLPKRVQASIAASRQKTFLQISGSEVVVFYGSIERMQEVGRASMGGEPGQVQLPADSRSVVLLLPPQQVLRKEVTLPAATEENLRDVLAFEMDQQTPFSADRVYYDFVVRERSSQNRSIVVELVVAPKRQLDDLLTSLSTVGFDPDIVSTRHGSAGIYDINLLPPDLLRSRPAAQDRLNLGLSVACFALLMAATAIPILQKHSAIVDLEPRVAAAMEAAREGSQMRQNIEAIVAGSRRLVEKKGSAPMIMRLLDEVTRIVPDGTWVSQLDVKGTEIQIQGQSPAAASLIGLLEESESFANPRFRSPVTQVPRSNLERFHLSAEWTGNPAP